MKAFHTGREAKEFLISELVAEAQRENVPLSDIERKMLYFTESGWTLADIPQFDCVRRTIRRESTVRGGDIPVLARHISFITYSLLLL